MTEALQNERRQHARQKVFLGGKITSDAHFEPFECVIRNLTGDGAHVVVQGNEKLPATFRLAIPAKQCVMRAKTIWRKGAAMGIFFDSFEFGGVNPGSNIVPETAARWRH